MRSYRSLSIVIPVFNSATSLPQLIERLEPLVGSEAMLVEVILVNDCSRDASWDVICEMAARHGWVHGINLMRNYGQHNALLCGIRAAKHRVIVTMDDDLQHPPEEIPRLLDKLAEGYDVVYGTPCRPQHSLWRNLASRLTRLALQSAVGAETARNASAFRAFRTDVREAFANYQSPFVALDVLLTWGTTRFASVSVHHDLRKEGSSNYTVRRLVTQALNLMTGFSTVPLQLASMIGFGFTIFGLGVLFYVLGRYAIQGGTVPGFPFLASTIAIFSGAQLFALGIIGEYLARMYFRTMERPVYVVRAATARTENLYPGPGSLTHESSGDEKPIIHPGQ